jgi:hypothetical protein
MMAAWPLIGFALPGDTSAVVTPPMRVTAIGSAFGLMPSLARSWAVDVSFASLASLVGRSMDTSTSPRVVKGSIIPGHTTMPEASTVRAASGIGICTPTAAIVPPSITTVARSCTVPSPTTTLPPVMAMTSAIAVGGNINRKQATAIVTVAGFT